ncbi:MAG: hypothetical protein AAGA29_12365 [Planctomycetota bacterium]
MTQRSLAVLVILNAVLIAAIAMTFGPGTSQVQAQGIGGGGYLMIAGDTQQRQQQAVVYVMQVNTGRVAAFLINSANGDVTLVGAREVANDLEDDGGR